MKTVEFFVFDQADGLDITGPLEVFSIATELFRHKGIDNRGYQVSFSAESLKPVILGSGMSINPVHALNERSATDYFVVPGGSGVDKTIKDKALMNLLAKRALNSKYVVSVCTGAFLLAEAGLLSSRTCTTHWIKVDELASQYPDTEVKNDSIFVQDGHIYTSAGITAGIDLALALVERDYGQELAMEISRMMVLYLRRPGSQSQFSAPVELRQSAGKEFSMLHDWILENIDQPLLVEDMAEKVAMSPRNFSRAFKAKTRMTPAKYVELVRLTKVRELLESTSQSVESIANLSGFLREERLRRAFVKLYGVTPSQYRHHFNAT